MSDNDPFAEPDDTDKTVIKPNPGGRRTPGAVPQPAAPEAGTDPLEIPASAYGVPQSSAQRRPAASAGAQTAKMAMTGMNQLTACASTLFSLISRIRNRAQHMDPDKLRQNVVSEVREFENRALQAGMSMAS